MATRTAEEIEEERRLLYVAMTRAKEELDLVVPQRFYTHNQPRLGDRHVYASRSRFIPDSILDAFECRAFHDGIESTIKPAANSRTTTDVAASLLRMWR
jgi:DNA helicase-2/ATP-dependent DNA helicase PcrA